jgi:hypothetical protein
MRELTFTPPDVSLTRSKLLIHPEIPHDCQSSTLPKINRAREVTMPARIPDHKRTQILASIRAGEETCRGIARHHNVSDATVRKIAKDAGITDAFTREQTKAATRARVVDMAARRARIAEDLLDDVARLRERAWSEYPVVVNTSDGPEVIHLPRPPLRDVQAAYTSVGIAMDKHLGITRHDADPGVESGRSMLVTLAAAVGVAHQQLTETPERQHEDHQPGL